ncbi:Group XIIB secretory phospholipase A2-like protein, partial [Ophiophagus hannah]
MGIPAMTKCCNQLDACYDTCGSNKYRCDAKFRWCMQSICSDLKRSLGFVSKVEACWDLNYQIAGNRQSAEVACSTAL